MVKKLKYTVLLDYILYVLSLAKTGGLKYVSLVSLVKSMEYETSFSDIQEIGKYMDTRGWARVIFSLGDIRAQITSRGIVYLEEKPGEFEQEFESYLDGLLHEKAMTRAEFIVHISEITDDPRKT